MNDLISRQAAMEEISKQQTYKMFEGEDTLYLDANDVGSVLASLPSAQPDSKETSYTHKALDTISRNAAIDALIGITRFKTKHELMQRVNASVQDEQGWLGAVAECLDEIEDLPSAQPEIIRCGQCKYAEVADKEDAQDGYTCQFHRGSVWFSGSYCSWAERRADG